VTMSDHPRPDLTRILPRPWLRTLATRNPPVGDGLRTPTAAGGSGFVLDIEHKPAPAPDHAGFGLHQAKAVAARVRDRLREPDDRASGYPTAGGPALGGRPPPVHRPDPERVQRLFDP
jgi:hypothetical protein